jgi:hypothetical protein
MDAVLPINHRAWLLAGWLLCMPAWSSVARAEPPRVLTDELREFEIRVKDKPAGRSTLRIVELDDGTSVAATDASVSLSLVVYTYHYEFHGREKWQNDQLLHVDNRAVDAGTQLAVRAEVDRQGSTIYVRGRPARRAPVLTMTTNYWHLPTADRSGGTLSVLDADTGTLHRARLERIGSEAMAVSGQRLACTRYHLAGSITAELWFDADNRLVRQQTVEDGYPTEMRLARLVRTLPDAEPRTASID